jgi:hypothetical protein
MHVCVSVFWHGFAVTAQVRNAPIQTNPAPSDEANNPTVDASGCCDQPIRRPPSQLADVFEATFFFHRTLSSA